MFNESDREDKSDVKDVGFRRMGGGSSSSGSGGKGKKEKKVRCLEVDGY